MYWFEKSNWTVLHSKFSFRASRMTPGCHMIMVRSINTPCFHWIENDYWDIKLCLRLALCYSILFLPLETLNFQKPFPRLQVCMHAKFLQSCPTL